MKRRYLTLVCAWIGLLPFYASAQNAEPPRPDRYADVPKPKGSTGHDFAKWGLDFNRRTLVGAYEQVGKHDAKWDAAAKKFLEGYAKRAGSLLNRRLYQEPAPEVAELIAMGKMMIATGGCEDPLVVFCYGSLLQDAGEPASATPLIRKTYAELKESNYPPNRIADAALRMARVATTDKGKHNALEIATHQRVKSLCGKMEPGDNRVLLAYAWDPLDKAPLPEQKAFLELLLAEKDADPWIRDVMTGRIEINLAWDSRGGGWANTVTEDGWKGFYKHLSAARDSLVHAWKLDPSLPQAPSEMITVAMGAGSQLGENPLEWFQRSIDAQVDFLNAYEHIRFSLLPRWGGSYPQLMTLALACGQSDQFDTVVPWQFVETLNDIGTDNEQGWKWLKDDSLYDKAVEIAEGYVKAQAKLGRPKDSEFFRTSHAALAWRAGRAQEAWAILDKQGSKIAPLAFLDFGVQDPAVAIGQIAALGGPKSQSVRDAESEVTRGNLPAALEKFKAAAKIMDPGTPATAYVNERAGQIEWKIRFDAGQWVSIQPKPSLEGWKVLEGSWHVDEKGGLVGIAAGPKGLESCKTILWQGTKSLGTNFEVAGHFEFIAAKPLYGTAGVTWYSESQTVREYGAWGTAAMKGKLSGDFTAHFNHDKVISQAVGVDPKVASLTEGVRSDMKIGVGGQRDAPARFTELRVRKLPETDKPRG